MNDTSEVLPARLARVAARLADEGIPVRAIARSIEFPSDVIRESLIDALGRGAILDIPRDDWPPTVKRDARTPFPVGEQPDDRAIVVECTRLFKVTRLQASLLSVLIRRKEASKEMLHQVVETCRHTRLNKSDALETTDPKIVDVVIYHIRQKLKPHLLEVTTLWGHGYCMAPEMRKRAADLLDEFRKRQEIQEAGDGDASA